ncbi:MAG: hypothetical protein QOH09_4923 [Pseudonocardiales bacterium]|jgi:hypothetical protein|nr:hypothetical protein [Pseudonocardiales bacterium]
MAGMGSPLCEYVKQWSVREAVSTGGEGGKPVRGKRDPNRRVIDVHCSTHGGPKGFTNLVATKRDDLIELDPHATGGCVIILDEKAASELFDALGEWLG